MKRRVDAARRALALLDLPKRFQHPLPPGGFSGFQRQRHNTFLTIYVIIEQFHPPLSALTLERLNGSSPAPPSMKLVTASSKLDTIILCTGGKVDAQDLRGESADSTLEFIQDALSWLKADSEGVCIFTQVLRGDSLARDEHVIRLYKTTLWSISH